MMVCENDKLNIPKKYLKMSSAELNVLRQKEYERLMTEKKLRPIAKKKKNRTSVIINI